MQWKIYASRAETIVRVSMLWNRCSPYLPVYVELDMLVTCQRIIPGSKGKLASQRANDMEAQLGGKIPSNEKLHVGHTVFVQTDLLDAALANERRISRALCTTVLTTSHRRGWVLVCILLEQEGAAKESTAGVNPLYSVDYTVPRFHVVGKGKFQGPSHKQEMEGRNIRYWSTG